MTRFRLRLVSSACVVLAVALYAVVVANYTEEQGSGKWQGDVLMVALFALLFLGIAAEVMRWRHRRR